MTKWIGFGVVVAGLACLACPAHAQSRGSYGPTRTWWNAGTDDMLPWSEEYDDADGQIQVANQKRVRSNQGSSFFEALGSNGRACVTCHQPSNAMSVSAASIRERWDATEGKDPIFAAVDGSNCPDLDQTAKSSHSLLLDRGLFPDCAATAGERR